MPENASVFTLTQLGAEGTAGTRGVPGTIVPSMAWKIDPDMTFQEFAPMGYKRNIEVVVGKEWCAFDIEGYGCYNCIVYPLSGVYGTATITAGSITQWTFTPSSTAVDPDKTFTIQNGSSVRAIDATYGRVTSFSYHIDRDKFEIGGGGFAQRMTEGTTLQGSAKTDSVARCGRLRRISSASCALVATMIRSDGTIPASRSIVAASIVLRPLSLRSCLGRARRLSGQNRVPAPPAPRGFGPRSGACQSGRRRLARPGG